MSDISNILFAVCGFGCVCCGAFVLGFGLLARVFGVSLLLPAITAVSSVIFDRDNEEESDLDVDFDQQSNIGRGSDLQARIQAANQQFSQSLNTNAPGQSFSAQGYTPPSAQTPSSNQPRFGGARPGQGAVPGQSPFEVDPNANVPYGANIRLGSNFNTGGQQPPANQPPSGNRFGVNPQLDPGQPQVGPDGQPLSAADRLRQRGYASDIDLGPVDMPGLRRRRARYDDEEEYFGSNDDDGDGLLDFFE